MYIECNHSLWSVKNRMKIECQSCSKVYNIPDDRLKTITKSAFHCPACNVLISFELPTSMKTSDKDVHDASAGVTIAVSEELKNEIYTAIKALEPMPEVVHKAREVMASPNATFKKIGAVIETDQAISATFLKIANSAYYGLSGRVSSIHQAMVVLGNDTIEQVVNTAGASKLFSNTMKGYELTPDIQWKHSLAVAAGARIIASKRNPALENDAFTAGLLHDIGKNILDGFVFNNKADFETVRMDKHSSRKAEEELFWFDHPQIGGLVCEEWKLPEIQATGIKYHHDPIKSGGNDLAYFVYLSNHLALKGGFGAENSIEEDVIPEDVLSFVGFTEEDLPAIIDEIQAYVGNVSSSVL